MRNYRLLGQWYGGPNYARGDSEDLEEFTSIAAAKDALRSRESRGYSFRQTFAYIHKPTDRTLTPCVDYASEIALYYWPTDRDVSELSLENGPDRVVRFGARGGVTVERY